VRFQIDLGKPAATARRRDDQPLTLLVLGNFSGATAAGAPWVPVKIDLDNFDAVFSAFEPSLDLELPGLAGARLKLRFGSLDDLHPDALFREWGVFSALREQRALLANPATFSQAAASLLDATKTAARDVVEGDMFERLLGSRGRDAAPTGGVVHQLISGVVAPYIVPDIAPEQSRYIASVDAAITATMRDILHAPAFQALEAAWRGVKALLDDTEGGDEIEIWLLDASAARMDADIAEHADDPAGSALHDVIVARAERAPDATPWSVVLGDYLFTADEAGLRRLATLGALARRAGAVFVGGADPRLASRVSFAKGAAAPAADAPVAESWRDLRRQPFAAHVALAAPRTLVRLPYGKGTDPIDAFAFEELADDAPPESLLWGNGAFVLARLLVRAFLANGWDAEPGDELEIDGFPALVRGRGDDRELQACAEGYLADGVAEKLLSLGLVPLQSHEKRPAVRAMRVQSVADPAAPLAFSRTNT